MADITKCNNESCKDNKTCYRFLAKPNPYWQSYFAADMPDSKEECDNYWETNELTNNKDNINE